MRRDATVLPRGIAIFLHKTFETRGMTMLPTLPTTSKTNSDEKRGKDERRKARSVHACAEKVLRVVFKAASPGSGPPHRYYRAILRGPSGSFHLAGGHVVLPSGGDYAEDTTAGSEPPLWIERDIGLRDALHAVNDFGPTRPSGDPYVAVQFLKGRTKCKALWELMTRWHREKKGDEDHGPETAPQYPASR